MIRVLLIALMISSVSSRELVSGERLTPERLWQLGRLGSACVNDQGTLIAYAVRHYDLQENEGKTDIHLFDIRNERDWVVLRNLNSVNSLQLVELPGGPRLFYVGAAADEKDEEAKPQVWSVDYVGAAPQRVTEIESGVGHLKVSPQGTHIAFTSDVTMDATVNEIYEDLPKAQARIIDSLHVPPLECLARLCVQPRVRGSLIRPRHGRRGGRSHEGTASRLSATTFWRRRSNSIGHPMAQQIAYTAKVVNDPAESTDSDIYVVGIDGEAKGPVYHPWHEWFRHRSGLFAVTEVTSHSTPCGGLDLKLTRIASCCSTGPIAACRS